MMSQWNSGPGRCLGRSRGGGGALRALAASQLWTRALSGPRQRRACPRRQRRQGRRQRQQAVVYVYVCNIGPGASRETRQMGECPLQRQALTSLSRARSRIVARPCKPRLLSCSAPAGPPPSPRAIPAIALPCSCARRSLARHFAGSTTAAAMLHQRAQLAGFRAHRAQGFARPTRESRRPSPTRRGRFPPPQRSHSAALGSRLLRSPWPPPGCCSPRREVEHRGAGGCVRWQGPGAALQRPHHRLHQGCAGLRCQGLLGAARSRSLAQQRDT